MKRVRINPYQVGLVFRNNAYIISITEGVYWFWRNEIVRIYEMTRPFVPAAELDILLQDKSLASLLEVIEVKDNEIVLHFENGKLEEVFSAGRYVFWKSIIRRSFVRADISNPVISNEIDPALLTTKLLVPFVRTVSVENCEKAALLIDGRFEKILESGVYYWWKNAVPVNIARADMRQLQLEINGQEIMTSDKAALRINAWAQYRVTDISKAVLENKDYEKQLYVVFQLALREYVAGYSFDELPGKKAEIAPLVIRAVEEKAAALGVTATGFGIRDIILPGEMKEIMNQVLIAEKKAQANSIMRREETASTRSLLNTARLMEENAMLWKLKEMEYVEKIADKISSINIGASGLFTEQLKQVFIPQK